MFTIVFDKTPKLIFVSRDGTGCGKVYINGERISGIQEVKIESKTNDATIHEIKFATAACGKKEVTRLE